MTTPATDGKMLVNALYHSAVVSGLAAGFSLLGEMAIGVNPQKLDFTPRDVCIVVVDIKNPSAAAKVTEQQAKD